MVHLDAQRWVELKENPGAHGELLRHLATSCEACEQFLAQLDDATLDGWADHVLLARVARSADDPRAEATFKRVLATVAPPRRAGWLSAVAAVVLSLVAGALGFAVYGNAGQDPQGIKGSASVQVEVQAVWKRLDGTLVRVHSGQVLAPEGELLLRYTASDAASARWVVARGAHREVLAELSLQPGTHDLALGAEMLGFSLEGESGVLELRLEAVSSAAAVLTFEVRH